MARKRKAAPEPDSPNKAAKAAAGEHAGAGAGSGNRTEAAPVAASETAARAEPPAADQPAPAETAVAAPPSATLYLNNLNDKISARDLRMALYMLFTPYGHIIAINAGGRRMRGQAHVAFVDTAAAAAALRDLQGRTVLGKPLRVAYARAPSQRLEWLRHNADAQK